jgi:acyl-homoserine lactone acylase PvdQ
MNRRRVFSLLCIAFVMAIGGCSASQGRGPAAGAASVGRADEYGRVELLRDHWGVPHVFADTDAGAMYGLGYAAAEDRAFQMHYNLRIIQGRLAELVGDVKVGVTRRLPQGRTSALRHDIEMRTIGYWPAAQETARQLDPEARRLLESYCRGVNDYIDNHRDRLLYLFEKYDLKPEPWTPAACIASWWRVGLFFSGDGLREITPYYEVKEDVREVRHFAPGDSAGAIEGRPVRDDASVIQRNDVSDRWVQQVIDYATEHHLTRTVEVRPRLERPGPRFSHAWVVGGKRTTTGSAVLVSDPQTPVRNPSLWQEFHICGKTFNTRGIGVAGSPNILIGFTPAVAWGLTALGADQADLFLLKTDPNHPDQYLLDGKWRDMDVRTETVAVKDGRPRTLKVRRTCFGPVVTSLAMGVHAGDEVALKRIPLCEPQRDTFRGLLDMMRAKDVREFQKALGGWSFPSANCVFGDRKGNIGFKTILALPLRSSHALLDDRAAHEGWDSANDWQGIVPHELLPQVINPEQGWLVSANHRPIASFYPISLGISTGSLGDTDRSWRLKERAKARERFTPEDVLDIHYDTVAPVKRDLVRLGYHLRDVQKYPLEEETLQALAYLEDWRAAGCRSEMAIRGTEILNLMPMAFRQNFAAATIYGGGVSGLCNMLQTLDARIAADPNDRLSEEEADYVNLILRAAWRYGKAAYGDDPNQWHERGMQALCATKLPYMSTLDGFGSLDDEKDVDLPALQCIDGGTILSQRAQSYTQYVPLHDVDQSLSLLPVGQSEHPDSEYRLCNYALWQQGRLHPAPLSRAAVGRLTVSRTVLNPGARR